MLNAWFPVPIRLFCFGMGFGFLGGGWSVRTLTGPWDTAWGSVFDPKGRMVITGCVIAYSVTCSTAWDVFNTVLDQLQNPKARVMVLDRLLGDIDASE